MPQIEQYDPPPNPAKDTDARFANYEAEFGDSSWELDALDPDVISDLIETEVDEIIDHDLWDESMAEETSNKKALEATSSNWPDVKDFLTREGHLDEED